MNEYEYVANSISRSVGQGHVSQADAHATNCAKSYDDENIDNGIHTFLLESSGYNRINIIIDLLNHRHHWNILLLVESLQN